MTVQNVLKHPAVSVAAVALGCCAGVYARPFARAVQPIGDIFLLLLTMCVLPILVTAIISSVGRIVADRERSFSMVRVALCYAAAFFFVEAVVLAVTALLKPGVLSAQAQDVLGAVLMQAEQGAPERVQSAAAGSRWDMLKKLIPANVFSALARGDSLQVLFASLAVGGAAGAVERTKAAEGQQAGIIALCGSLFSVMTSLLSAFMLFLPLGLFAMTAGQVAAIGTDIIRALARFVACIYLACAALFAAGSALIAFWRHISFARAVVSVKDSLLLAFAARSSLAAMPVAIADVERLGIEKRVVDVMVPLGAVVARFSMVILYAAAMLFTAQLYELPLNLAQLCKGMLLCLAASVAGIGSPAVVSLSLLSMVFAPIGLPHSAMTTLLLVIVAIIDPVLTAESVHANCVLAVLLGGRRKRSA